METAKLEKEIQGELEGLKTIDLGSNEHKNAVDSVSKLIDKLNDTRKLEADLAGQAADRELEHTMKQKQMDDKNAELAQAAKNAKSEKRSRWVGHALTALGLVVSAGLAVWGTVVTLDFEETGTVSTSAGRAAMNRTLNAFKK